MGDGHELHTESSDRPFQSDGNTGMFVMSAILTVTLCLRSQSKSLLHDSSLSIFSPPSILKDTMNNEMPHDKHIRSSTPVSSQSCHRRDRDVSGAQPLFRSNCSSPSHVDRISVQCFNCADDRASYEQSFCDAPFATAVYPNYLPFGCKS